MAPDALVLAITIFGFQGQPVSEIESVRAMTLRECQTLQTLVGRNLPNTVYQGRRLQRANTVCHDFSTEILNDALRISQSTLERLQRQ